MSLKTKFKTDSNAARDGVWFDFSAHPNADGTIPGFRLARSSKHNKKYIAAVRKHTEKYQTEEGVVSLEDITEEQSDRMLLEVFIDTILLEWRNFQPDDDGKDLPFSRDNAMFIFASDDWADLYADLTDKAKKAANFRQKSLEAQAKN